jgi:hypothetical protein
MTDPQLPETETTLATAGRLGYFVVRVRRLPGMPIGECTGLVERLATGEKREFRSSGELAAVVAEWSR